jgi:ABC-2 type transport system permease protein
MTLVRDTWTLTTRVLRHNTRSPDTIMTVVGMPLMILLAFVFVLGGAMSTGAIPYVDFVVPVVLLMCISSGVGYTAFRVNLDATNGMFSRFRAMPIARGAVLGGHLVASVIVNAISVAIVLAVAFAIGYRPSAGTGAWALTAAVLIAALVVFSMLGVAFGLAAKTSEGSSVFSYLVMGLLFVSSGFAPTSTMPAGLAAFANHQPMTAIIDSLRSAQLSLPDQGSTPRALAWLAAMLLAFTALAAWANNRAATRRTSLSN